MSHTLIGIKQLSHDGVQVAVQRHALQWYLEGDSSCTIGW